MYLAQLSSLQTQAPFYVNILENITKGSANSDSITNINSAILEAVNVAKGNKNVFSIDNNHYFFITTLLAKYKDNLLKIEERDFQKTTYSDIILILK